MRILMIVHVPWSQNLGGSRVQLELAEEFRKMGHTVEKFSYEDAFPHKQSRLEALTSNFSAKAKVFVKENSHRFDIIEAHQTDLPYSKKKLDFKGLLVGRSVGLIPMYKIFDEEAKAKLQERTTIKSFVKQLISYPSYRRRYMDVLPSFQACDIINVANQDELAYVTEIMKLGHKCVSFPFGLSDQRQTEFSQAVLPVNTRLANKQVAFVGNWCYRKGSKDWGEIIRRIQLQVPDANFLFLGTGFNREKVLQDLKISNIDCVKVIPEFNSKQLPSLLSSATVGAFPSYIEGFGFAVLEKLACGLPTVTYDVPGPREMMQHLNPEWMVPAGDVEKFSDQVVKLLTLSEEKYSSLSNKCLEVAQLFSWNDIATKTIKVYLDILEKIQTNQ